MQAEGREWLELFSHESRERFDYVFTDAMTWTNDNGIRMRPWIQEETEVGDPQDFMDQLVDRIVNIVTTEPIDIYVNPTFCLMRSMTSMMNSGPKSAWTGWWLPWWRVEWPWRSTTEGRYPVRPF